MGLAFPTSAKANRRELVARTKHDLKELEAMGELRIIIEGREWRLLPPIPPKRDAGGDSDASWDAPATRPKLAYPYLYRGGGAWEVWPPCCPAPPPTLTKI